MRGRFTCPLITRGPHGAFGKRNGAFPRSNQEPNRLLRLGCLLLAAQSNEFRGHARPKTKTARL